MPDALAIARIADCSAWAYRTKRSPELMRSSTRQFLEIFKWLGHDWETCAVIRQSQHLARYDLLNQQRFEGSLAWDWVDTGDAVVQPPVSSERALGGYSPMGVLSRAADHHDHGAVTEHYGMDHVEQYQISVDYWKRAFETTPEFCYVPLLNHAGVKMSKSGEPGVLFHQVQRANPGRVWRVFSSLASRGQVEFPEVWPPRELDQELYQFSLRWIPSSRPIEITHDDVLEMLGESRRLVVSLDAPLPSDTFPRT